MSKATKGQGSSVPTTPVVASRVQGAVARSAGGVVAPSSYVGRMQGAAARNFGRSGSKK